MYVFHYTIQHQLARLVPSAPLYPVSSHSKIDIDPAMDAALRACHVLAMSTDTIASLTSAAVLHAVYAVHRSFQRP